jgi:protein O-mannosyl-transferase
VALRFPRIETSSPAWSRADSWAGGCILVATLLAYLPALGGGFIWNDADYVTAPALRSWSGLWRIWTEFGATEQYYPVLHSAFWVQYQWWGDNTFGYHVFNVVAHGGGAVLFGAVLRRLQVPGAWLAAALFALHPVQVESVAWIAEQKNTLSLLFYLAAAWAYLRFDENRRPGPYAMACVWFTLALLSKTVTATLPAALLVVAWWRRGRIEWRRDVQPLLPWLVVGGGFGLLSGWIERHYGGAGGNEFDLRWLERVLIAGRAFWFYVHSLVWPFNLNFIYERWIPDVRAWWQWLFPAGVVALVVLAWAIRARSRAPLAGVLFFAGTLFPALGFVNLYGARYSWVWDHWQYLPNLGPMALAGAGWAWLAQRAGRRWRFMAAAGAAAVLMLAGVLTWRHSRVFHDDELLFTTTLQRNPDAWMAAGNLGSRLAADPVRRDEAIHYFEWALRLKPDLPELHEGLGTLLAQDDGKHARALEHYEIALRLDSNRPTTLNQLGILRLRSGDPTGAVAAFQRSLELAPELASAGANLGTVLVLLGRPSEAVPILQRAIAAAPDQPAAYLALGDAERALGKLAEAERNYRQALQKDPEAIDVRLRIADLLMEQGREREGAMLLREALARDSGAVEARYQLGRWLLRSGEVAGGIREIREVVRLRPDWASAQVTLGNALARTGDMTGAMGAFRAALAAQPDDLAARNNLANALLAAGHVAESIHEYELALRQQPDNTSLRENLALARELLRQRGGR